MPLLHPQHPALDTGISRRIFTLISLLRATFLSALVLGVHHLFPLGTNPVLLSVGIFAGVLLGSRLAFSQLGRTGFFLLLTLVIVAYFTLSYLGNLVPLRTNIFAWYTISQHLDFFFLLAILACVATWGFWRSRHALTLEIATLCTASIAILAQHRDYRFDLLSFLNSLAWQWGTSPLLILISIGVILGSTLFLYCFLCTLPSRPYPEQTSAGIVVHKPSRYFFSYILTASALCLILYFIAQRTYAVHNLAAQEILKNGVSDEAESGTSPLGFHSALGNSPEPAAIVRLEGDYPLNPFKPMLYFREAALSEFNGEEMVAADKLFDQDVSRTHPSVAYQNNSVLPKDERIEVKQSIYLLSSHKLAFAVDYPLNIKQLELPSSRFKQAYRAESLAPIFDLAELQYAEVGNPKWSESEWEHYLKRHPNPRYASFAQEVTDATYPPIGKALQIVQYLNKNAIYTLSPNHDVGDGDDPVEPFLFGDLRGYCVHFAHATTYMLRSLGIPARIGTGYLSDLSQSRDGHILLRNNDRHAWAELYIAGIGWVPFDTQPEQVELHGETPVDMELLEELMGLIGPDKEILGDIPEYQSEEEQQNVSTWQPDSLPLLLIVCLLLASLLLAKLYLISAWRLYSDPEKRTKLCYRAYLAVLYDLGFARNNSETRREYAARMNTQHKLNLHDLTHLVELGKYGNTPYASGTENATASFTDLEQFPWYRKLLASIKPNALFRYLAGEGL